MKTLKNANELRRVFFFCPHCLTLEGYREWVWGVFLFVYYGFFC